MKKVLKIKFNRQEDLGKELKFRQSEMVTMAMSIIHKNEFLNSLKNEIIKIKANIKDHETRLGLNKLSLMITQDFRLIETGKNSKCILMSKTAILSIVYQNHSRQ